MGVVWLARERSLDRLVALKLIAVEDPRLRQRLLREGQAAGRLRHPNIVAVHAMGGDGASTFLAMDFIEGGNLDARLQGRPLPPLVAAEVVSKIAGALAHAHAAGLIHRDVKPSNVLMDLDGEPRLADFGMAAPLEGGGDLTAPGTIAGTPAYLAPELLSGSEAAKAESDIYSLGAVLYACLTGRPPFVGATAAAVLAQLPVADPLPPHLLQPGLPRDLETICLKCLEKSPDRRYPSADLLRADLEAFLRGEPIAARPVGRIERAARYCRRHPSLALSTALAAILLLTLAIGGPVMALRLARSEREALAAQAQTEKANAATLERLRDSLLARSRATRLAGGRGQRDDALAAATEAARIRKGLDARDEVIAALTRPEIVTLRDVTVRRVGDGAITFDLDHDRYASEAAAGQIELRRFSDNGLIRTLRGAASKLWSEPVFSPDGRWIAVRDDNGRELVWKDTGEDPVFVLPNRPYVLSRRYLGYGSPEAFSPDGRTMASSLPDGGVAFHSTEDGREILRVPTDTVVTHLAYSRDGRWIAIGRGLRGRLGEEVASVRIMDVAKGTDVCRLPVESSYQTLTWDPDGSRILVGGNELQIFSVPSGRRLRRLIDPPAIKAFFGPGGNTVLSGTSGGFLTLWDLGTARPMLVAGLGSQGGMGTNADCSVIVKEAGNNLVRLYRLEMSRVVSTLPVHSEDVRDNVLSAAVPVVDYSPDGSLIVTAVWGAVQLRDSAGKVLSVSPQGTASNNCSVLFARDGSSVLAASSELGLVSLPIVRSAAGNPELGKGRPVDPEPGFFIAGVSHDGSRAVLTSIYSGQCKVVRLDATAPDLRWPLVGAAGAAFLEGDREILVNSLDDVGGAPLELRDAATGRQSKVLKYRHGAHVHVSADGAWVLLGEGDDHTRLLHAADFSEGPLLPTEVQGRGSQPAFCPDGSSIAFGVGDKVVLVRVSDGAVIANLQSSQGGKYIPGLCFSPDGAQIAVWWENGQLALWDLRALRRELASRGLDW